jgi:tRNA dimethylallyltransferase
MGIEYTNFNKLLCIVGPTATGKTDVALLLAKKFQGELVACDSRQVYIGLDLGTGKDASSNQSVSKFKKYWLIDGIKVWMYDMVSFVTQYTISDYIKDATAIVNQITRNYKLPIIVGGTGFYLTGLLKGVETDTIPADKELRSELELLSIEEIQKKLIDLSPEYFDSLNNSEKNNTRRLIRKIEVLKYQMANPSQSNNISGLLKKYQVLKIGLIADKKVLDQRVETRVVKRVEQGMLEEALELHRKGLTYDRMRELGLEYGVMADYFEGVIPTKEHFITILQLKIKQYVKRQLTWFKKDQEIIWIDITQKNYLQKVEKLVQDWYNTGVS